MDKYEHLKFKDNNFPVIFHFDYLRKNQRLKEHWHEHLEILYCVEGEVNFVTSSGKIPVKKGNVTVITPRCLHFPCAGENEYAKYYCLIPGASVYEQMGTF